MDKENIKHLKDFIKKQKEIEKNLKKDQVIIRRLFTPDGHIMQELIDIIRYYNNKMDLS